MGFCTVTALRIRNRNKYFDSSWSGRNSRCL